MKVKEGITVDGHLGTWYVVEGKTDELFGEVYLLEHEEFGDTVAGVIVNKDYYVILDDVWNGFDDLDAYKDGLFED